MKIQNISFAHYAKSKINNNQKHISYDTNPIPGDSVSFKGRKELTPEEKFERAMDIVSCFSKEQIQNMDDFDQGHLEGIQHGLKTFEGMNFKEIYFLLSKMGELCVPVIRDCSGMCPVCSVNGLPKDRKTPELLDRIDFEDYSNFTHDLKTINERLGFDMEEAALSERSLLEKFIGLTPMVSLFHDSDCKDVWIKDKDGKIHEFPELNKMLFDATGIKGIFDTTGGWSRSNEKVQKRMESLADYYTKPENQNEIEQINISLNPYHGIMEKANKFKNKGDIDGYNRLKSTYVKNIANAMYTFTPLIDFDAYQILAKAFQDDEDSKFDDYKVPVLEQLKEEVFEVLEKRYSDDLKNKNYKFVKNKGDISDLMNKIKRKSYGVSVAFLPSARKNIFSDIPVDQKYIFPKYSALGPVLKKTDLFVDINGKIYFKNDFQVFKTDKSFNFKNKDRPTKQIYPQPEKRIISIENRDFIDY